MSSSAPSHVKPASGVLAGGGDMGALDLVRRGLIADAGVPLLLKPFTPVGRVTGWRRCGSR